MTTDGIIDGRTTEKGTTETGAAKKATVDEGTTAKGNTNNLAKQECNDSSMDHNRTTEKSYSDKDTTEKGATGKGVLSDISLDGSGPEDIPYIKVDSGPGPLLAATKLRLFNIDKPSSTMIKTLQDRHKKKCFKYLKKKRYAFSPVFFFYIKVFSQHSGLLLFWADFDLKERIYPVPKFINTYVKN